MTSQVIPYVRAAIAGSIKAAGRHISRVTRRASYAVAYDVLLKEKRIRSSLSRGEVILT